MPGLGAPKLSDRQGRRNAFVVANTNPARSGVCGVRTSSARGDQDRSIAAMKSSKVFSVTRIQDTDSFWNAA